MDKPQITYKVLQQSADIGGRYYAVVDNSRPVPASVAIQQIVEFKKLYNYSAKQIEQLVEDVLQGAAELVGRDGLARNVSSLLKFEPRIRGTFANTEAGVTNQKVIVAPRMLKDIRVDIDKNDFSFANVNDSTAPKISAVALESAEFTGWNMAAFKNWEEDPVAPAKIAPLAALTISGTRLCPSGWTSDCEVGITIYRRGEIFARLDFAAFHSDNVDAETGFYNVTTPSVASENVITFPIVSALDAPYWRAAGDTPVPTSARANAAAYLYSDATASARYDFAPQAGDVLVVTFGRELLDGSHTIARTAKEYVIGE